MPPKPKRRSPRIREDEGGTTTTKVSSSSHRGKSTTTKPAATSPADASSSKRAASKPSSNPSSKPTNVVENNANNPSIATDIDVTAASNASPKAIISTNNDNESSTDSNRRASSVLKKIYDTTISLGARITGGTPTNHCNDDSQLDMGVAVGNMECNTEKIDESETAENGDDESENGDDESSGASVVSHKLGKTSGMTAEDYTSGDGQRGDQRRNKSRSSKKKCDNMILSLDDFECSDESEYENLPADDSDDDLFTSFQKNDQPLTNRVMGGPSKPDTSKMSDYDAANAMADYKSARKKYTDKLRHDRIKAAQLSTIELRPEECSGDNTNGLRPMTVVENKRLMAGHTFTTKEIVWMRIAEEANRRRISYTTEVSNHHNLVVSGDRFRVEVSFSEKSKWKVILAAVREGDKGVDMSSDDWVGKPSGKPRKGEKSTPFRSAWVAQAIAPMISENPGKI